MITSASNSKILNAKKLLQKKYRDEFGKYLIEGIKLVSEAFCRNQKVDFVIVKEDCFDKFKDFLEDKAFLVLEDKTFKSLTDAVNDQGILAVAYKPETKIVAPTQKCLILENIQDPSNMGAILRTAAATGYNTVYTVDCADPFSPKCMRAGMSAQFCVSIMSGTITEVFEAVKQKCRILCADMKGEDIFSAKIEPFHALLFGNEGSGVSQFAFDNCDYRISLPMQNRLESLNVAVSAGVIMYTISYKNSIKA
jgi:TrmH family RNA methyltransferase